MDKLNDYSYAYHYRNLDTAELYARRAYDISIDYDDGRAEAINNLAFVYTMRMDYDRAMDLLNDVTVETNNCVELLVTAVQQMRLCQRMSHNREFYTYMEEATNLLNRVNEERDILDARLQRRMAYAESEYAIVASTYYYYVGLEGQSREALSKINIDDKIRNDTAQYLNYLYNVGAGGIVVANTQSEVCLQEFGALLECFFTARQYNYIFFVANALEAMAEHLLDSAQRTLILDNYAIPIGLIVPNVKDSTSLAGHMADTSLMLFEQYGDKYQTAGAHRTLASYFTAIGDYESALFHLEESLSDTVVNRTPELVASIREQLSVAYSAIDDKVASDYNRNIYLDMQERTRQDRSLEAYADMLDRTSFQLNIMIVVVVFAIVLLLFLLWFFSYLDHRKRRVNNIDSMFQPLLQWQKENLHQTEMMRERQKNVAEKYTISEARREDMERRNVDNRAKVALVRSTLPLIDRMLNEVRILTERKETDEVRAYRYKYVAELTDRINQYNEVLTNWIQLRQGLFNLRIESFPLMPLFDIVAKGRTGFRLKGVELNVKHTEATVKADRVLTLFMINTLADNARKFTDTGGKVTISAMETNDYVEVSVADTGQGMSSNEVNDIFSRKVFGDRGFGLKNCRDIIEKYRKTSRLFAPCLLSAESEKGRGSRFFFRLPRGMVRLIVGGVVALCPVSLFADRHLSDLSRAASFADSAYFSNIAGTYSRTLKYADSCRYYLNLHYLRTHPQSRTLMVAIGNTAMAIPEICWYKDSVPTNYNVILDIRNESAVAALALHEWSLYKYNNKVYTQLFKEFSADDTISDYCRVMQQSQISKTITVCICVLVLLLILPAYYMLYYRHRLYYRFCVERIDSVNAVLLGNLPPEKKLQYIEPCLNEDYPERLKTVVEHIVAVLRKAVDVCRHQAYNLEMAEDELRRSEHEGNNIYVCNAVLDNCLSVLKHETMYYPSRIHQLVDSDNRNVNDLYETVTYYRELCSLLGRQAASQLESVPIKVSMLQASTIVPDAPSDVIIIGNRNLLLYLFDLLRKQSEDARVTYVHTDNHRYAVFDVVIMATDNNLFVPTEENIPYLICRQIVREHSEATDRCGCGIVTEAINGHTTIKIILPRKA